MTKGWGAPITWLAIGMAWGCGGPERAEPDAAANPIPDAALDAPATADLILDRDEIDFGWVCAGMRGEATVQIVNAGGVASSPVVASISGEGVELFEIVENTCEDGVAARAFCEVRVAFAPVLSPFDSAVTLELSAREGTWSLPLSAEVPSCESRFTISPTSHAFPDTEPGARSEVTLFTITNFASFRTPPLTVGMTGVDARQFELSVVGDTCSDRSVPALGSCTVGVVYVPSSLGIHQAQLQAHIAGDYVQAFVQGRARWTTGLAFTGASTDFGVSCTPVTGDIELTNHGEVASGPIVVSMEGGDAAAFSIVRDACAPGLAPGERCAVTVTLGEGLAAGAYASMLRASWATSSLEHPVAGVRTDCPPTVPLTPAANDFGGLPVGEVSVPVRFTLRNDTASPLGPLTMLLRGTTPAEFGFAADLCTGTTLSPGSSCTIDVTFQPTAVGDASATLEAFDGSTRASAPLFGRGN